MSNIRAICFDLFYTLVDPHAELEHLEYDCLGVNQQTWSAAMWNPKDSEERGLGLVKTQEEIFHRVFAKLPETITEAQKQECIRLHLERMHLTMTTMDPVIVDTIKTLKQRGYKLGLISNADVVDQLYWRLTPMATLLDDVIFSCDVGLLKPDPAIYRLSMEHLGVTPQETAFVGDGGSDEMHGAQSLGITSICTEYLCRRKGAERSNILRYADHTVTKFGSLKRFFPDIR